MTPREHDPRAMLDAVTPDPASIDAARALADAVVDPMTDDD